MGYMIRSFDPDANLTGELTDESALAAIEAVLPQQAIQAVIDDLGVGEDRRRKLPAELTTLLVVAMNLFSALPLEHVLVKLLQGLRLLWPDPDFATASKSAVCQARYRLGARALVGLFHQVCRPLAGEDTPGAYLFGLRLVAVDGTTEDVPDTPANVRAFGRHMSGRGEAAFPQVKGVYLVECGTHAIFEAGFWPGQTSDHRGARRLLRSVNDGMLVLWDSGLHSYELAKGTRDRLAHFLGRVPANVSLKPIAQALDGSYYAYIYPADPRRKRRGEHLMVRVIEYILTDPARPGCAERHRLMTSLLDAERYPAVELVLAYHERWEFELSVDETDTHQRLAQHPLRSKKPVGVIQELYGLLIAHYAVRKLMHEAALQAGLDPDRLSFSKAVRLICDAVIEFQMVSVSQRPQLYRRLLRDLARRPLPARDNRSNPRVVKRKMSKFDRKRPEHRCWPQPSGPFREAVRVLN